MYMWFVYFAFILLSLQMQIVEDLHAARVDKKIALPVVETCGELTSMEIDLPDVEANTSSSTFTWIECFLVSSMGREE